MSRRAYFASTILLTLGIAWAIIDLGNILELKSRIQGDERAGTWVKVDDTQILWDEFVLSHVAKEQLNEFHFFLLTQRESVLWGAYYILMGCLGGIVSYWLFVSGIRPRDGIKEESLAPRLASSAASGFTIFLVLLLPAPLLTRLFTMDLGVGSEGSSPLEALDSLSALPLMAGLFAAVFFERLETWFRQLLKTNKDGNTDDVDPSPTS